VGVVSTSVVLRCAHPYRSRLLQVDPVNELMKGE
jgi:hypothetical protein